MYGGRNGVRDAERDHRRGDDGVEGAAGAEKDAAENDDEDGREIERVQG